MRTRIITRYFEDLKASEIKNENECEVIIDFDKASEAWKSNKKSIGNGYYVYICGNKNKAGKRCNKNVPLGQCFCSQHNI